ncbi:MAG TPA: glycosyltransferase [Blastocatellia bacterium]|nr:glycosyltransferase [Blastocatellia bacterium]
MRAKPRVAFFTDSYLEVNGVAQTSRQFAEYARRRGLPMLCVHAGPETREIREESLTRLALKRSRVGFQFEADQRFDLLLWRHFGTALEAVKKFQPDLVHLTGPSDVGQLGAYLAHRLRLPVVMSWHTNLHEYAADRLSNLIGLRFDALRQALDTWTRRQSLRLLLKFYRTGRVILAPNEELGELLGRECERPVFIMRRGVDTELFSPARRERDDSVFTLGYVGRLTPEKNVRLLAELEKGLVAAGRPDFRFVIVGTGSELGWLEQNMQRAEFTGVLKGEALARAYANLDLFIFPSQTDTFGNVVLEAQASGLPAVVSSKGGPKFTVRDGDTGFVAAGEEDFLKAAITLMSESKKLRQLSEGARRMACGATWDKIFDHVYEAYDFCLREFEKPRLVDGTAKYPKYAKAG